MAPTVLHTEARRPSDEEQYGIGAKAFPTNIWTTLNAMKVLHGTFDEDLSRLDIQDRINLIEESLILFNSKRITGDRLLVLMTELSRQEKDGPVFQALVNAFETLSITFNRQNSTLDRTLVQFGHLTLGDMIFKRFSRQIIAPPPPSDDGAGISNETFDWDSVGKSSVLEKLVLLDYKPAIARALQLYDETAPRSSKQAAAGKQNATTVNFYLRDPVYAAVARRGNDQQFRRLISMFNNNSPGDSFAPEHRAQILGAMCRSDNRTRLTSAWNLVMDSMKEANRKKNKMNADQMADDDDNSNHLDPLITMTQDNNRVGRQFVLHLLAHNLTDIIDLNDEEPIVELLEWLYLNSAPDELAKMNEVVMKLEGDPMSDWPKSLKFIMQMLDWRADVRNHSASAIESSLKSLLQNEKQLSAAPAATR